MLHRWALPLAIHAYFTAVSVILLNSVRSLGSHRFTNAQGQMTFQEQLLDTLNYPYRPWITELWGPLGLRFQALHHLFPSLPSTIAELWCQANATATRHSGRAVR